MKAFKIGDKVYLLHDTDFEKAGDIGIVTQIYEDTVLVVFRGCVGVNLLRNEIEICKN